MESNRQHHLSSLASKSDGYYYKIDNKEKSSEHTKTHSESHNIAKIFKQVLSTRKSRKIPPNKKFIEDFEIAGESKVRQSNETIEYQHDNNDTECIKATEIFGKEITRIENLFEDSIDIEGTKIYAFHTPKKRNGMTLKALATPKNPLQTYTVPKTPTNVRLKTKSEISKLFIESDFSADESDYNPDKSSETESSDGNSSKEYLPGDFNKPLANIRPPKDMSLPSTGRRVQVKNLIEYIPKSDGYFKSFANKKIITSDHTLNRLKNPRLVHSQLCSLLALMKISNQHERCLTAILKEYKTYFNKWLQLLDEGYNILLYGLGSKRRLLQSFHREILQRRPVIVVNGCFPSLTVKDILDGINQDILEINASSSNLHEVVDMIEMQLAKLPKTHIFFIFHNIDGPMFRNQKAQEVFGRLVLIPNIHLIASMDHINTPLLWDHMKLNNYNFSWWDVTTMLPYGDETSFENFMLVQNSSELALSSMNNVFQSLTSNARKVYMLIVEQQLRNKNDCNYQGVPLRDVYWLSREAFLVSSDLALRAQLTEFLDHKLVKLRRAADGTEHLSIPISKNMLEQFAEQYKQ